MTTLQQKVIITANQFEQRDPITVK